jgi:hypothetical protein
LTKIASYLEIGIDVFKGKADKVVKKDSAGGELPWLNENTPEFEGAVKKMKAGQSSIEALKKYFRISKAIEGKLNEASKNGQTVTA